MKYSDNNRSVRHTQPLRAARPGADSEAGSNIYFTTRNKNIFYYGGKIIKEQKNTHSYTQKKHDTENLSLRKLSPEKVCLASAHTGQARSHTATLKLALSALTQHEDVL